VGTDKCKDGVLLNGLRFIPSSMKITHRIKNYTQILCDDNKNIFPYIKSFNFIIHF